MKKSFVECYFKVRGVFSVVLSLFHFSADITQKNKVRCLHLIIYIGEICFQVGKNSKIKNSRFKVNTPAICIERGVYPSPIR